MHYSSVSAAVPQITPAQALDWTRDAFEALRGSPARAFCSMKSLHRSQLGKNRRLHIEKRSPKHTLLDAKWKCLDACVPGNNLRILQR